MQQVHKEIIPLQNVTLFLWPDLEYTLLKSRKTILAARRVDIFLSMIVLLTTAQVNVILILIISSYPWLVKFSIHERATVCP